MATVRAHPRAMSFREQARREISAVIGQLKRTRPVCPACGAKPWTTSMLVGQPLIKRLDNALVMIDSAALEDPLPLQLDNDQIGR